MSEINDLHLSKRALLVSCNRSMWRATRLDKAVTKETNQRHGASDNAGQYRKNLLPAGAEKYEAVRKAYQEVYDTHVAQTLPWGENGTRVLPVTNFIAYTDKMRAAMAKADQAVRDFLPEYPALVQEARASLNGMFKEEDYPSPSELAGRFRIAVQHWPMPEAGDWRADLPPAVVEDLAAGTAAHLTAAAAAAMRDAWERLAGALRHMADRLGNDSGRLYESVFTNLEELCDLLPRLNLAGDPCLDIAAEEIRTKLLGYTKDEVKKEPELRKAIAADAERILAEIMGCAK